MSKGGKKYAVGIDLGTTNTAVAVVPLEDAKAPPHAVELEQVTEAGEHQARALLPSFLYLPADVELPAGALALPWDKKAKSCVGHFARERSAHVPGRVVSSAKSWLSHAGVDRRGQFAVGRAHHAAQAGKAIVDQALDGLARRHRLRSAAVAEQPRQLFARLLERAARLRLGFDDNAARCAAAQRGLRPAGRVPAAPGHARDPRFDPGGGRRWRHPRLGHAPAATLGPAASRLGARAPACPGGARAAAGLRRRALDHLLVAADAAVALPAHRPRLNAAFRGRSRRRR